MMMITDTNRGVYIIIVRVILVTDYTVIAVCACIAIVIIEG